jgi:hypothetical protein
VGTGFYFFVNLKNKFKMFSIGNQKDVPRFEDELAFCAEGSTRLLARWLLPASSGFSLYSSINLPRN